MAAFMAHATGYTVRPRAPDPSVSPHPYRGSTPVGAGAMGPTRMAKNDKNGTRHRTIARGGELSWDEAENVLSMEMNNERASLSVSVVDSLTASVRVIAPDRPGLMRDITRALTSQGFFIDSATVSTKDGETADNTFTIKLEKKDTTLCDSWKDFTCPTLLGTVETLLVEAAMDAWGGSTPADVQYVAPEDRLVEATATATEVESSLTKSGKCVMVNVVATDRNGLLAATTAALHDIGCGIISATVMTKNGVANNSFVVSAPDGCGAEAVKLACLAIASK